MCFLSLSEFVYQRALGAIPTRLPETFVISRAQAMDVLCDRDAMSPRGSGSFQEWYSLSKLAIGIDFSYPSWTCTLVKNSTCLTFLSFWSGCSIKRVLPNTLDVQAQFLQWLSTASKGGPHARVPRTLSLSVGKLGD